MKFTQFLVDKMFFKTSLDSLLLELVFATPTLFTFITFLGFLSYFWMKLGSVTKRVFSSPYVLTVANCPMAFSSWSLLRSLWLGSLSLSTQISIMTPFLHYYF